MSQWEKDLGLFGFREERPQSIHTFASIHLKLCGQIFYLFFFFSLKNQITEDLFLTLVKCCLCEEWRHCSSEVLLFIFMDQNLSIWDHLIPTIQSLMWSTCQYVIVRERPGLIWIWRGETTSNTYIRLNSFETIWSDILLFFLLKESDNRGLIFDFSEMLLLWRVTAL